MSETSKRLRRRRDAKSQLARISANRVSALVIHYSCESFYDRPDGSSPRVTSIAIRSLDSGCTTSFSIHQLAERNKKLTVEDINSNYDELEKKMLKEFYAFAEKHPKHIWLHWNMRDINYGFPALQHRYRVLGGTPFEIHEAQLVDIARLLVGLYGGNYASHPRLTRLVEMNSISDMGFLTGEAEAAAFVKGEYVQLHQSTLRKADILSTILDQTIDGTLKTSATMTDIYGGYFAAACEFVLTHWIIAVIGVVSAVAGLVQMAFGG